MKVCARHFNLYLALAVALVLVCGCQTDKADKKISALRIHLEVAEGTQSSQPVSVLRSDPLAVNIATEPILTEANVVAAKVINAPGGFAIEIRLDESGARMLENYSASNPGRHLVIFGQWGETITDGRWLAAPLIAHRIADGLISFTPDMTPDEADQFVLGLNNNAKKIAGGLLK
jgi:preprotein translocase subunit SecD